MIHNWEITERLNNEGIPSQPANLGTPLTLTLPKKLKNCCFTFSEHFDALTSRRKCILKLDS